MSDVQMIAPPPTHTHTQVFQKEGLKLTGILETHFHADFVSGHYELSQRTGAPIYFGPTAKERTKFEIHEVQDGEVCVWVWSGGRGVVRVRVRGDGVVRGERGGTCESEGRWGCQGGEGWHV